MTLKKIVINTKKISSLIYLFIYSLICSTLLIFIPVLFGVKLKPLDTKFIDLLLPIARNQYYLPFRSNDTRNYLLGIIIILVTTLIYFVIYLRTLNKKNNSKIHLKYFFYFIAFIFFSYITVIGYKYIKTGWSNTSSLLHLSLEYFSNIKYYSQFIYFLFAGFVITYFTTKLKLLFKLKKILYRLLLYKLHIPSIYINIFAFLFIFVMLFNPKYKFSFEKISNYGGEEIHQFHHANFFIAPINEVINGKMLLVNAQAQYGILLTYLSAIILKFFGFSYSNFNLYNIIVSIIYVYVFYLFLVKSTNNRLLSFIGTIAFIKLSFFRIFWPYEIYTLPSTTPIRYLFDIFAIYSVHNLYVDYSKRKLIFASIILSLTFFYNTEIGISIVLAYLGVVGINLFLNIKNNDKTLFKAFFSIICLIFFLLITTFLISILTYLRVGQFPDWFSYFSYIFIYGKGAFDIPMPFVGPYYFVIIVYIITFYSLIYKYVTKKFNNFYISLFILFYGILNFFYYLVFSEPHHFLTIIHPSIILSIFLLNDFIKNKSNLSKVPAFQKALFITFIFFVFGYFFSEPIKTWKYLLLRFNNRYGISSNIYYYWKNKGANFYLSDNNGSDFIKSVNAIESFSKHEKNIVVLSRYDTLFYVMTQKTSLLNHPIVEYDLTFIKDREYAINTILSSKPSYIYIFSDNYSTMVSWTIHEIWDAVKDKYSFVKNIGVVDVYMLKK